MLYPCGKARVMARTLDLIGNTYGDFTVIEMVYKKCGKNNRAFCKCIGIDGNEYTIRADALQSGATKHIKNVGKKCIKNDLTGQRFGHVIVLYDTGFRNNQGHVRWHCKCDCGNEFDTYSTNLVDGHTRSCGCNKHSKWEEFIADYLVSKSITFDHQKRFPDCKNKKGTDMLPFDFYIPKQNLLIEYDGLHHFEPVKGWGGEEKFKITQENDAIKNKYCKDKNIRLLRIPYWNTEDDIIKCIDNYMSPVTITA